MDTPRKFNFIDLYFDLSGEIEDKSTRKLYPQGNYQSVIYANFRAAEPANVMNIAFELANGQDIDERPMYYVGKKINDGIEYHSWEFVLPDVIATTFRKDREVPLLIQFTEREISEFIGVYDEASDLPTGGGVEEGAYAWVLSNERVYGYVDDGDGSLEWEIQNSLETYEQVFGSDLISVTVAKSLRVQRETVDIDTSELVLKALARTQADALKIDGNNAEDDIDINGVTFNHDRTTDAIQGSEYDARVSSVNTSISDLQSDKYDKTGGTITGNVNITGTTNIDGVTTMNNTLDMTDHDIINVNEISVDSITIDGFNIGQNLDRKLNRDGSNTMTGDLDMDNNSIDNVTNINNVGVTGVFDNVAGLISGSVLADRAKNTDDGAGNANTAQAIAQTVGHVNQDVKDTSTPTFSGVTLGDKTLTNQKLTDLDDAKTHADISTGNPHGTVASDISVTATGYDAPNQPLDTDADTIQKAFNQLYTHDHDQEYVKLSQLGIDSVEGENAITGVATLGTDGRVVPGQLPSYVDDIVEFDTFADLPATGSTGKIYIVNSDPDPAKNTSYRWSGSNYFVFDQTTAEWGSISGEVTDQTDIENALFTSTVNEGIITTTTLKGSINELDAGLKSTNSTVSGNTSNIGSNTTAIGTNTTDIARIRSAENTQENGDYRIAFTIGDSDLESTNLEDAIKEVQDNVDAVDEKVDNIVDGTTDITFAPGDSGLTSTKIEEAIKEVQGTASTNETDIGNIVDGTTDIDFDAGDSGLESTKIEAAIIEVQSNASTNTEAITNIEDGTTDITFTPGDSGLSSTKIEAAIKEIYAEKGEDNGIATLDSTGRIPATQLSLTAIEFKGTFGSASSTTEGDLPTNAIKGDLYVSDTDDYASAVASITFNTGDKALFDGANWVKNDAQDAVVSVNTKTGAVTLGAGDIGVNASGFDGELSTDDDTIQKALETLDTHSHDFSEITNKPTTVSGYSITDVYTKTNLDNGQLDNRYYTETELNNGQLDNRYYTETELDDGQLDNRYYTETELNDGQLDNRYYTENELDGFLNSKVDVGSIESDDVSYDNTNSSLQASNLQTAVDELDNVLQSNITAIRVEQFEIISVDASNNSFVYQDADLQNQTGTIDGDGFYIFDLQVSGYYTNNNLAEVNINDDIHYYTSDGDQFREGDGDSEGVATSVKVKHTFAPGDEIDVRYYQGLNIAASAVGDGAVSFAKLDATLQSDIQEVKDASSTNAANTIVKRNASNEFQGILDGKFKTARTIALEGDVTGQAQFDGSSGITIQTVVSKENFDGGSASSVFSAQDNTIEGGGA